MSILTKLIRNVIVINFLVTNVDQNPNNEQREMFSRPLESHEIL